MTSFLESEQHNSTGIIIANDRLELNYADEAAQLILNKSELESVLNTYKQFRGSFCLLEIRCEIEVTVYESFIIFVVKDLTDYIDTQAKLEKAYMVEEELSQVINSSFDGITIIDREGTIVHQNPASEEITGISADQLIGRNMKDLVDEGMFDHSVTFKVLEENKASSIIQQVSTGRQVLVSGAPVRDKNGEIVRVVCSTRDLTILNDLEKEIMNLQEENAQVNRELEELRSKHDAYGQFIAHDEQTKSLMERVKRVALIDSVVLITGESGVGKEGIVNLIHQNSNRSHAPLVKINCGAIPEHLLESELFGYEPGAFTGADQKGKKGLFEAAEGGTVFLDEIGEMPLRLQVKLLRVLQEYEITRVGGVDPIKVDVRVITATNVNLKELINEKEFREDLFYRINVIPINVPPLRERREDIIPLVYHFQNQMKARYGIQRSFSQDVLEAFYNGDWRGNVRELKNLVERVSLMVDKSIICLEDVEQELTNQPKRANKLDDHRQGEVNSAKILPLKKQVSEFEKTIIKQTVHLFPSVRQAAKALKVDQSTLVRKMQRYELTRNS